MPLASPTTNPFIKFCLLPPEVRLKIWSFAQESRALLICVYEAPSAKNICLKSNSVPPALLAVNHESREETLKSYVLTRDPQFYFNPALDTLFFYKSIYADKGVGDWLTALRAVKFEETILPVAIYEDLEGSYVSNWSGKEWARFEIFLIANLGSHEWSAWPRATTKDYFFSDEGRPLIYEDDFYGTLEEEFLQSRSRLYLHNPPLPKMESVEFWDFQNLAFMGTLR